MATVTVGELRDYLKEVADAVVNGKMQVTDADVKTVLDTIKSVLQSGVNTYDTNALAELQAIKNKLNGTLLTQLTGRNVEQTLLFDGTIAAGGTAFLPSNWTTVCISKNRPFAIVANTYGLFKKWKITVIFRAGTNGNPEYITDIGSFVIDRSTTANRFGSVAIDVPRGSHFNLQVENLETTDINIRIWLVQL